MSEFISKFELINGSEFELNDHITKIINTCSIDYFLIIFAIVNKDSDYKWFDERWNSLNVRNISANVFTNRWNEACLDFIKNFEHIKPNIKYFEKTIIYDCFLAENDSYYKIFERNQTYK